MSPGFRDARVKTGILLLCPTQQLRLLRFYLPLGFPMDLSSANHWLSEVEMEDQAVFDEQWQSAGVFDEQLDFNFQTFSSESHSSLFQPASSSSSRVISFTNDSHRHFYDQKPKEQPVSQTQSPKERIHSSNPSNGSSIHAHDHVIAERKRREKLSQQFVALSAIVPGLMKTDKASILGDAIKYTKQLQETVNALEEHTRKRTVESVVLMNKSQLSTEDDNSSSSTDENFAGNSDLPQIEVKVSERNVLLRFHCLKQRGFLVNLLTEIENLHLTALNTGVLPFGDYAIDITIIAKMDEGFCLTAKDLLGSLRVAIANFDVM